MDASPLTLRRIFRFWLPLAATWLMMAVEGPFLAAIIARLPEPTFNLAAYGVAYALALVVEAPVIMLLSLSTALARNRAAYLRLRNFTHSLNLSVTLAMALTLVPPIFDWLASDLIGLPPAVASRTHLALFILLPWPATIGLRRFYQGILIRHGMTRMVAYGTVIRLASMACTAGLLALLGTVDGAAVGAAALTAGVTAESAAAWLMARRPVQQLLANLETPTGAAASLSGLARFYYPLALTTLLSLGIQPVVTFFVGNSRAAIESLAVLPVVSALVFIFRALGLAYQEVVIALIGDEQHGYPCLRRFAVLLALAAAGLLALIVWTPLSKIWFETVSGLAPELAAFAVTPARILAPIAALTALLSFQRAVMVVRQTTDSITWATIIEVVGVVAVLWLTISVYDLVGAVAATAALLIGRLGANLFLVPALRATRPPARC
jgi:hypothetical protein